MTADVVYLADVPAHLDEGDVWRCLGTRGRTLPALADEVRSALAVGRALAKPAAVCRRLPVREVKRGKVSFDGGLVLEGKLLAHCFRGAAEGVFLLATIGPALEARVSELFAEGQSLEAFILDAAGSAAMLSAFGQVVSRVWQEATERGWKSGLCLRPGQSYWDLAGQRAVFQVAPAERIGMRLLESCFMVPQKSQSTVIPQGPSLKVAADARESSCRDCKATRCPLRIDT